MQKKLMVIAILALVALAVLNLAYDSGIKPDAEFPMANRHIEWHYAGK